ncbi:MAG: hypothetical protein AAF798_22145 [Bacteroidota bacterium]
MSRLSQTLFADWSIPRILYHFMYKLLATLWRVFDGIRLIPRRLLRLIDHFIHGIYWIEFRLRKPSNPIEMLAQMGFWWIELVLYTLDLLGIGEWYETLCDWVKLNTRSLKDWELQLARQVFGDTINYRRVRIDQLATLGPWQKQVCYVSFNTVNSWGNMNNSLLIHELVHVWQYQQIGMVYMPRAIAGMLSAAGYNYGGVGALQEAKERGQSLGDFNLEQQADIVADYYRISSGYRPAWGNGKTTDLPIYEYFIQQLQRPLPTRKSF